MATDHQEARARRRLVFWHELKAPIGTLQTLLDVLADGAPALTPEQQDLLARARRQVLRATEQVAAAHDAERLAAGRLAFADERVDLAAVARAALAGCEARAAAKGLRLEPAAPAQGLSTRSDPTQVRRGLEACARAAVECSARDGAVTLCCLAKGAAAQVQLTLSGVADPEALAQGAEDWSEVGLHGGGIGLYEARLLIETLGGALRVRLGEPGSDPAAAIELELPLR